MCDYAVEAGQLTPQNALFIDYSNLPDAVPEHVFPVHFGMEEEMDKVPTHASIRCIYIFAHAPKSVFLYKFSSLPSKMKSATFFGSHFVFAST